VIYNSKIVDRNFMKGVKMRISKYVFLAMVLMFVFQASAFAGAPAPTTERPIPVEKVATPPPAPTEPAQATAKPLVISKHFTLGLGLGGNPIIGFVEKDDYGYPRTEYGLISGIGIGMTWFKGNPSAEEINAAVQSVKTKNPNISDADLPSAVRTELGVNSLTYVGLGIINAEMGMEWILGDNVRTRLGIGLPTLISFGINFDF
jgi:hypothetical protein